MPLEGLCALRRFISFSGCTDGAKEKLGFARETSQSLLHSFICRVEVSEGKGKEERKETPRRGEEVGFGAEKELFLVSLAWLTEGGARVLGPLRLNEICTFFHRRR